jgi:hypothetical protein
MIPGAGQVATLRAHWQSAHLCAGYNSRTEVGEGIP